MYNKIKGYINNNVIGNAFSLILAIGFFLFIANFSYVKSSFSNFLAIISPFIYGYALAFILNRPIIWFRTKVFHKFKPNISKSLSISITYICFLLMMIALCLAIIPQTIDTLRTIVDGIPAFIEKSTVVISNFVNNFEIGDSILEEVYSLWQTISVYITNIAGNIISQVLSASISIGSIIINTLTALIASIYMQISKDDLIFQIKKLLFAFIDKTHVSRILEIGTRANNIFSGFLIGKMIDSAIIGVICFIFMLFLYPPFALIISVIIGVTNMIPFFGPFIGAVPCAFILLMVSPMTTLIFIGFIIILQQVDGNIIGPKILGDSTGLSPFWVLVSIIVGNGLFGLVGMLIGVPTFAVFYSIISETVSNKLSKKNIQVADIIEK